MERDDYGRFNVSREDNSILKENLALEVNPYIRLKKYIISLRRKKSPSLFRSYKVFLRENIDTFTRELSIRDLVSQVDTFADFGNDVEKAIAFGVTNFLFQEKLFLTTKVIYSLRKKENTASTISIIPDFNSVRLSYDDAPIVFLKRLSELYAQSPSLQKIWLAILRKLIKDPKSSMYMLLDNISDEMKRDYSPQLDELLETGVFCEKSVLKIEGMKKHSYTFNKIRILYIANCGEVSSYREDGVNIYRCLNFIEGLNKRGDVTSSLIHFNEFIMEDCDLYDVFVFSRPSYSPKLDMLIKKLENLGKTYVAEFDDLIFDTENTHHYPSNRGRLSTGGAALPDAPTVLRKKALALFSQVLVSTHNLAKRVMEIFPESSVKVVPNCIPGSWLERSSAKSSFSSDNTRYIGYFSGSPTHDEDFAVAEDDLIRIMEEFPDTKLLLVGKINVHNIDPKRIVRFSKVPYLEMIPLIKKCRVTIAPLVLTPFTICKSSVKFLEAISSGVTCLASPIEDMVRNKDYGCEVTSDWYASLKRILTDSSVTEKNKKIFTKNKDKLEVSYHLEDLLSFLRKKNISPTKTD